jgi:hypothetical protein
MPAGTRSAVTMLTDFCAADDSEATACRTGFVQRMSKMTGTRFLALVTFGAWSEAKTTLAPLAATATQWCQPVDVSPEAMHRRMNTKAMAFLQDMRCQTLATYSIPSTICVMIACLPPLSKAIELAALDLNFPKNATRCFLALEGVRRK